MSSVGSVGSTPPPYQPVAKTAVQPKSNQTPSTKAVSTNDTDHDGDSDKGGLDVKG